MKKLSSIIFLMIVFGLLAPADAVLIDRGTGMIYDTDLGITWLQDANYAQTSGYDADGRMTWYEANSWAQNLVVNVDGKPISGWRLPSISNGPYAWGYDGTTTAGFNITSSEMGHLFYTELGNKGLYDSSGNLQLFGYSDALVNTGPFVNLQSDYYWTDTPITTGTYPQGAAYMFYFTDGSQFEKNVISPYFSMAVRDGDTGPSVSEGNPFSTDFITLSDTFSFDYFWLMEEEPTNFNFDLMVFYGGGWEMLGGIPNFSGSSDDWSTFSMIVPVWARGLQTQIRFVLADFGQGTDPTVFQLTSKFMNDFK